MEDFTAYRHTPYSTPTQNQSHAEFLHAATLRYNITSELHALSIVELQMVVDLIGLVKMEKAAHEDGDKQQNVG